jgi:hypothetical protein
MEAHDADDFYFFGIVVQMYWGDHPPPHIHVFYQGFEALFALEDSALIGGDLPPAVNVWFAVGRKRSVAAIGI